MNVNTLSYCPHTQNIITAATCTDALTWARAFSIFSIMHTVFKELLSFCFLVLNIVTSITFTFETVLTMLLISVSGHCYCSNSQHIPQCLKIDAMSRGQTLEIKMAVTTEIRRIREKSFPAIHKSMAGKEGKVCYNSGGIF